MQGKIGSFPNDRILIKSQRPAESVRCIRDHRAHSNFLITGYIEYQAKLESLAKVESSLSRE